MSAYDKYQQAWGIESGLRAGKAFLDRFVPRVLGNPLVRGALNNPIVRVGGGLASKVFSLPAQLVVSELAQANPWGNKDSAMYGKGPGSLEYAAAIERANAAGRSKPIEEDYLATPPITTDVEVAPTVNQKVDGFLSTNFLGGPLPNTSPSTGMANIPSTVGDTGMSHKDFEIKQLQDQGGYIPPGMTTSDGTDVIAQAGGAQSAFESAKQSWLDKTANSPAAKAGFDPDERWNLHMNDQAWNKQMGRGYNQDLEPYLQPYSSETQWK